MRETLMVAASLDRRSLLLALAAGACGGPAFAGGASGAAIPGVPVAKPERVGMSAERLARIGELMDRYVQKGKIPGAVTAVARHDRLVHFEAHGVADPGSGAPAKLDTLYAMMSSTKPVTAVALLQQMEAGRVRLDDPISKFIPELKAFRGAAKPGTPPPGLGKSYTDDQIEPVTREITIKHLVTHTSGLNAFPPRQGADTLATSIPRLADSVLEFQPGTRWSYSALTGPDVLARVVEITSGLPYDRYLQENVFDPVGMKDTTFAPSAAQAARQAKLYRPDGGKWVPMVLPGFNGEPSPYKPGSFGLFSTAGDYLQFETMLLNKGKIHGRRVLKPSSVELMSSNLIGDLYNGFDGKEKGVGFGMLVAVITDAEANEGPRSVGAFGWQGAFGTTSWTDPALDLVAVIMTQFPDPDALRDFQTAVRDAVLT